MKKSTAKVKEQMVRHLIREMVRKVLKEEEEEAAAEDGTDAAEEAPEEQEPTPEPKKAPEPAPEEEQGLNPDFQAAVDGMIQKLSQSTGNPGPNDIIDMLSQVMERFTTSSEERLNVLKGIRNNLVH